MTILRALFNKKGTSIISNELVAKVSESEKSDTVFMSKDEIEDVNFLSKVNDILAKNQLTLVIAKAVQCKNGNYRTFIGDMNYIQPSTIIA